MNLVRTVAIAALGFIATLASASGPRQVIPFNSDWRFLRHESSTASQLTSSEPDWQKVSLPHDWNVADVLPGTKMYAGPAWYRKQFLAPKQWTGKRVFVRFGAASLMADVYLNGQKLGQHRGGFAAFSYEISSALKIGQTNLFAVRVDNRRGEISPLGGDFTIPGGLYRPAELIITNPTNITPVDFASSGVYAKQSSVTSEIAKIEVTTKLSNSSLAAVQGAVRAELLDATGRSVALTESPLEIATGSPTESVQKLVVSKPHLWNGVKDPYRYRLKVDVLVGKQVVDEVTQSIGLRSFSVDPLHGYVLNGHVMQIHGVDLHQDGGDHGWAVTPQDEERDLKIIREMGIDGLRLAHYQHSDHFHDLCDRAGVLLWSELAVVNNLDASDEFRDNVHQQLRELILQNYNHPSIVMWSMYNELASKNKTDPGQFVEDLNQLSHTLDPTRPTTGAASGDTMWNLPTVMNAVDLVSLNLYQGWYGGKASQMGPEIDRFNTRYGSKGVSISEYGGGASVKQHDQLLLKQPSPNSRWHPEEYQAVLHEETYHQIAARPFVWGSFVWVMFDFPSAGRHEGDTDGINDKGLVTRDRKVKKDAFYFYKAHWSDTPFVYITSRRDDHRTASSTRVKIYSNCPSVSLTVNGKLYPLVVQKDEHIYIAEGIPLIEGDNVIETTGTSRGITTSDSCHWLYKP
jgi:beta-galactosidase